MAQLEKVTIEKLIETPVEELDNWHIEERKAILRLQEAASVLLAMHPDWDITIERPAYHAPAVKSRKK